MKVKVLHEAGYEEALYGLSLSFKDRAIPFENWWTKSKFDRLNNLVKVQHELDGGHNKFLESMQMWVEIEAPRGWWSEFDTYRLMTKQSGSTMHTIQRRPLTLEDCELGTDKRLIDIFNEILVEETNNFTNTKMLTGESLQRVKWNLPEGFLQTRVVCLNYKNLRNIIMQRYNHRLSQWQFFITAIKEQCGFPDLLPNKNTEKEETNGN